MQRRPCDPYLEPPGWADPERYEQIVRGRGRRLAEEADEDDWNEAVDGPAADVLADRYFAGD